MTDYLLDTNHVSRFLAGDSHLKARVEASRNQEDRFGISMTVLGELFYAAYASQRREENLKRLETFLGSVLVWEFDREAAREFGVLQAEQKAKGKPIPPLDAQIAAVARVHGLTVLSADAHFTWVDLLSVENWLQP